MTYVDAGSFPRAPLVAGQAYDRINRFFRLLGQAGGADYLDADQTQSSSRRSPLEDSLRRVQDSISEISMHLPSGFSPGLNRQFANLMDDDAWEDEDELIGSEAVTAFLLMLIFTGTKRRPGIGTNGKGSITASWTVQTNRLTIECLPTGRISLVLSRETVGGDVERAAFGPFRPERIIDLLAPFRPEVWFDR